MSEKIQNMRIREKFVKFLEENYNPPLRTLAKEIGVGYQGLVSWKTGSIEFGEKNLKKIELFIDKHNK